MWTDCVSRTGGEQQVHRNAPNHFIASLPRSARLPGAYHSIGAYPGEPSVRDL
jgi:hypothetical protein